MLVGCATVASLFPFIGTIVYSIVRPPEYLEDAHEREVEIRAAEARLRCSRAAPAATAARDRAELPALPELHAKAQGAVQQLRQAARPALARLPVLRGRGGGSPRRRARGGVDLGETRPQPRVARPPPAAARGQTIAEPTASLGASAVARRLRLGADGERNRLTSSPPCPTAH